MPSPWGSPRNDGWNGEANRASEYQEAVGWWAMGNPPPPSTCVSIKSLSIHPSEYSSEGGNGGDGSAARVRISSAIWEA